MQTVRHSTHLVSFHRCCLRRKYLPPRHQWPQPRKWKQAKSASPIFICKCIQHDARASTASAIRSSCALLLLLCSADTFWSAAALLIIGWEWSREYVCASSQFSRMCCRLRAAASIWKCGGGDQWSPGCRLADWLALACCLVISRNTPALN
jgi:hypothetical protein